MDKLGRQLVEATRNGNVSEVEELLRDKNRSAAAREQAMEVAHDMKAVAVEYGDRNAVAEYDAILTMLAEARGRGGRRRKTRKQSRRSVKNGR